MIIIRHRTGPLNGAVQSVEASSGRITFGRSHECDVTYPPDLRAVSRRHFAIERRPSGQWTFDVFGDLFVAMNGTPVESGAVVRSGSIIELGRRGGPSFEIEIEEDTRTSTMPLTELQ